jgi:peroxiredoxin (alkyl hydroperoxide reductase subunit C)
MSLIQKLAPDFQATAVYPDGEARALRLSDYRGKRNVVLIFYPFDFTFLCPTEILAFSKHIADFERRNVQLIGCSIDSQHVHRAWRNTPPEQGGIGAIEYPLIADVDRLVARDFGVLLEGGMAARGTFLIDRKGVVRHELVNDLPLGRSVEETLRIVDALQYTEEHGEACPDEWTKGKPPM